MSLLCLPVSLWANNIPHLIQMALHMAFLLNPLPGLLAEIHRDFYLHDKHLSTFVAPCQGSLLSAWHFPPSFVFFPRHVSHLSLAFFHHLILPPLSLSAFSVRPPKVVLNKWRGICYGRWWMTSPIWRHRAPPTRAATCRPYDLALTWKILQRYIHKERKGKRKKMYLKGASPRQEFPSCIQTLVMYWK